MNTLTKENKKEIDKKLLNSIIPIIRLYNVPVVYQKALIEAYHQGAIDALLIFKNI